MLIHLNSELIGCETLAELVRAGGLPSSLMGWQRRWRMVLFNRIYNSSELFKKKLIPIFNNLADSETIIITAA